jgi:glycine/D-amino acid oxidase-like deaminating enzyme
MLPRGSPLGDTRRVATRSTSTYRSLSLWHDTVPDPLERRPSLAGDLDVDVAIVGAGYTGLWTAYYLAAADPHLRIAVLERETAGFGASGRNGGWCSALFPTSAHKLTRMAGREATTAMQRAMQATVDEVGRVVAAEGIDCHWSKGGTVLLARSPLQLRRAEEEVREARSLGLGEDDLRLLGASEARSVLAATEVLGGTYTPHCAAIHPSRLVRGLAEAVERRGVRVLEGTEVESISPGAARTAAGLVRAAHVVRATEGYSPRLPGLRRAIAPVFSLMIATEPLRPEQWEAIGLARRETFGDYRNVIIYGQRTADGRLAFGGRGAPYHFGSRVRPEFDREPAVFANLRRVRLGRARPGDRAGVGRRLCRRRRRHQQPRRPHARRPDPEARQRAGAAAVGGPPLPALGAGAAALARRERGAAARLLGRPGRGQERPHLARRQGARPAARSLIPRLGPLRVQCADQVRLRRAWRLPHASRRRSRTTARPRASAAQAHSTAKPAHGASG